MKLTTTYLYITKKNIMNNPKHYFDLKHTLIEGTTIDLSPLEQHIGERKTFKRGEICFSNSFLKPGLNPKTKIQIDFDTEKGAFVISSIGEMSPFLKSMFIANSIYPTIFS